MKVSTKVALGVLAVIFTIGLTYASVELPLLTSRVLMEHLNTPGFDPTYHPEETEAFLGAHHLRLIGIVGLLLTSAMIFIIASIPFVLFDWPPRTGWWGFPYNVYPLAG